MANKEHLSILKDERGVSAWNTWRSKRPEIIPDLSEANLVGANLSGAGLILADLSGAGLVGANLSEADLRGTNLSRANLSGADLSGAVLVGANLSEADLRGTNLRGADLSDSTMGNTSLPDVDLSGVMGLETVKHSGPSFIGIDTIFRSKGKIPKVFLEGAGVPEKFILYMDSLVWEGFEFYSCFVSYSTKEEDFARRLYDDLKSREVRCWFFPEDAKWGEPVWGEITKWTSIYDKLVVICSEDSLQSGPVLREIERALQREDREKKNVLFPIRIDDYLFKKWDHPRQPDVVSKVAGDFRDWKDQKAYGKALDRLVDALNKPQNKDGA
jgi:uncharacterized protein YjbI with pentapeptide repeats